MCCSMAPDGTARARWYSWDAPDDALPFGPWVRTLSPAQPVGAPLVDVRFGTIVLVGARGITPLR